MSKQPIYQIISRLKRYLFRYQRIIQASLIVALTIIATIAVLSALSSPKAPRLTTGRGDALYSASNKVFSASLGSKSGAPIVKLSRGDAGVQFALAGSNAVEPLKSSSTSLTYPEIQPGVDLVYTTLPHGIKEELILHQTTGPAKPNSHIFLFDLSLANASSRSLTNLTSQTSDPHNRQESDLLLSSHTIYDQQGDYLFHFEPPFAIDSAGNRTDNVVLQIMQDKQIPGNYSMKLIVDQDWLSDPARAYPITIDPTIVHDTTAEFATGTFNRVFDAGSGSDPRLESYYQELPADEYTVGLWHMNEGTDNTCSGGQDVCDSSNRANHGTFYGNMAFTSNSRIGNYAIVSDGTGDSTCLGDVELTNGKFITIEAWVKLNTLTEYESIVAKNSSTWAYALQGDSTSGIIRFWVDNNDYTTDAESNTSIADGRWHHIVGVYDGTLSTANTKLYVDGILQTKTANQTIDIPNTADQLCMGGYNTSGSGSIDGSIDEVRISNIARTPEEIKASASRRPSAVYTSEVIDLTSVASWNSLSWTELGVTTGDGETLKDDTSLVAQWNFNETSGTTATNNAGSCGASCNGTLTNFASTASQDQAAGTGWTANNRRWGAGALMFDGSNDYVSIPSGAGINSTGSIELWFKANAIGSKDYIWVDEQDGNHEIRIMIYGGKLYFYGYDNAAYQFQLETPFSDTGNWHHLVGVFTTNDARLYLDGQLKASDTSVNMGTFTHNYINFGYRASGNDGAATRFNGTIDSTRIYSRALTSSEIMSNYQAGQIELQTRVGADTSPDDGSWEAWAPVSGETAIDSYDGPYQYNTTDSGLVSYWPMDESVNDSCSGGQDTCDVKSTNHGTATGTKIVDGKYGKARSFNGTSDLISLGTSSLPTGTNPVTIEAWFKIQSGYSGRPIIAGYGGNGVNDFLSFFLGIQITTPKLTIRCNGADFNGTKTISYNEWHHAVAIDDGVNMKLYLDGVLDVSGARCSTTKTGTIARIGRWIDSESDWFKGEIDEVRIYSSELSDTNIRQKYLEGTTRPETLHPLTDSTYKIEGSSSQKIETGRPLLDGSTVALWHLDETGGTGAYIKDSSGNANHLTPTGTGTTNGVSNKSRDLDGSSDVLVKSSPTGLPTGASARTIELWIKPDNTNPGGTLVHYGNDATAGQEYILQMFNSAGTQYLFTDGVNAGNNITITGAEIPSAGKWSYIAFTLNGSNGWIYYLNGVSTKSGTFGTAINTATPTVLNIGDRTDTAQANFPGLIDEVRISNVARSAEEIAEAYRAGRDHYINKTISATDLSGKTTLPFYVAADRPGSYLSATIGESAYANYQADTNTRGLWHFEETSGTVNTYLKDSSGNNFNSSSVSNTASVQGKLGKALSFNGSSSSVALSVTKPTLPFTIEMWVNPASATPVGMIDSAPNVGDVIRNYTAGNLEWWNGAPSVPLNLTANQWQHLVFMFSHDGTNRRIDYYKNGQLQANASAVGTSSFAWTTFTLGSINGGGAGRYTGLMDELRISNGTRSPDEIRQAYEVGLRTHPITIDFGANLDAGNLITGSGDLSFTVDATAYGLSTKGSMLFAGDKVIVRENYDGTEYIAQGTVTGVTASTGAVTVASWDAGSTFPSGGYTASASVFKWQREYWNHRGEVLGSHLDAITNLSLRLTDGNEGRTIWLDDLRSSGGYLTTPAGSTITSSTGNRYFQYRAVLSSSDEAVSPQLSQLTLDYESNAPPGTPSLNAPTDTATNRSLTPILQTTATDSDSDYLRYKIELCTNLGMTTGCQTFDQTLSQTGWSGQNAQTSTAYTSGTQANYTLQTPLTAGTTYYWRSYAIDPAGTNTWSATQGTPYSFTTTTSPSAPTTPWTEGSANPTKVTDTTPEFSAIHNDVDGDPAVYYEIEVNTGNTFTGTVMWDSNQTAMTSLASGVRSTDVSYAGSALSWGTTYYWRIRFTDNLGAVGAWSATSSFTMNATSLTPTLSSPANGATAIGLLPTLQTTATDSDSDYLRYKIELCTNLGMTTGCQTFDQTISQTGWTGQDAETSTAYASGTQASYTIASPLTTSTTYYWRSYAIDPAGTDTWSTTQSTPYSFTTTSAPLSATSCRIDESPNDTSFIIMWSDLSPDENRYEVQRSVNGGSWAVLATDLPANTTELEDQTIISGNTYRYRIAPYFLGPTYGDWCYTATLSLQFGTFSFEGINFN